MTARIDMDHVRAALTLPEYFVRIGAELRRSGDGWRGPCPLCGGSRAATKLHVTRDGAFAKCHACGVGGDVATWIAAVERLSPGEAVRRAADLAGVAPDADPHAAAERNAEHKARALAARNKADAERTAKILAARERWHRLPPGVGQSPRLPPPSRSGPVAPRRRADGPCGFRVARSAGLRRLDGPDDAASHEGAHAEWPDLPVPMQVRL